MKTQKKAPRIVLGAVLATCVGGAALLAASPASAAGGAEWNKFIQIAKSSAETGAPLSGAVFRVEVSNPDRFYTGLGGESFDEVDPSTWSFASAADHPPLTVAEYIQNGIDRHNAGITGNQAVIDGYLAQVLDPAIVATHEATIAEWQAAVDAAAPYNEASAAANTERQRLAEEILATQAQGGSPSVELVEAHAAAQQAQTDAIAAAAPYNDAVAALAGGAQQARSALDASNAAQAELDTRFPGGYLPWAIDNHGVNTAAFEASQPAWADAEAVKVAAGLAQAACNAEWGVSTEPTLVSGSGAGAVYSYEIATCDGVATLPIGSYAHSITEITAPEGYILDDTRYEVIQTSESGFTFNGGTFDTRGAVLPITNEPVTPPVEPPTPPVAPPVTPPAPPVTPEKPVAEELAYTGSDANVAGIAGLAGLLALAGGALTLFRRRMAE